LLSLEVLSSSFYSLGYYLFEETGWLGVLLSSWLNIVDLFFKFFEEALVIDSFGVANVLKLFDGWKQLFLLSGDISVNSCWF